MSENVILGIDTSNYTTSVSVLNEDGRLLANIKRPLTVAAGERGLRQSDALFAHVKNLPSAFEEAADVIGDGRVVAVGVSEKPRNVEGSYMPCFLGGVNAAYAASVSSHARLYKFSHQCGHVMAAIYSSGNFSLLDRDFAAFHISGGTTELLRVHPTCDAFIADHIGGTKDLNAGQLIDRIGVKMGLPFPCGPHLEKAALLCTDKIPKRKVSRDGLWLNLSGVENIAAGIFEKTGDIGITSSFIFEYLGNAISELSEEYENHYGKTHFVYAGGVMCNSIIKNKLSSRFDCSFAEPSMSADNAVGIAYLAYRKYKKEFFGE